jgi:hypothetical protein
VNRHFARWIFGRAPGTRIPLLSWPLAVLAALALLAASVLVLNDLRFNNSPEVYYPEDSPAVMLRDELRRDFPGDEVLTVIFRGDDLYERDFLQRLARLTDALSRSPEVDRVTTVTTLERISGSNDGFSVEKLLSPQRMRSDTAAQLQARVMSDRFAPGAIASRDLRHMAMVVRPKALTESSQRLALSLTVARAINEAGLRGHYAGHRSELDHYSSRALARIWKAERFSWWFTSLTHRFPETGGFEQRIQEAELGYIVQSKAASTALAENYVGLPLDFAES